MGPILTAKEIGVLRKSLQKASLQSLANGDLVSQAVSVVATEYPQELALDILSLHLNLYRQLRALFESDLLHSTAADLVHVCLAPAFVPGKPAASLLWTSVDSSNRTRALRAAEALSAAGRMVDKLPAPSTSSSSVENLLVPSLRAAALSRDLAKTDLIIINCLIPHVPVHVVPETLVPRILGQMDILDGANLRGNIVASVLLRQSVLVQNESDKDQAIIDSLVGLFDPTLPPAVLLNVTRYLLPPLFAARPSLAGALLATLSRSPLPEMFSSWISVAALGVSSGHLDVAELPKQELKDASSHADVSVSIRVLQLLVGSKNLLRKDIAAQVKDCLSTNMVIASAGARSEFGSAMYALSKKLAEIQYSLRKAPPTDKRLAVAEDLHHFLLTEYIDPGLVLACRHPVVQAIQALNVLRLYLDIFGREIGVQTTVFTPDRVQLLFACQLSEFTEVRGRARAILEGAKVPLAGYEGLTSPSAAAILSTCLSSLDHPRRTQAEAGKSALCIIFQKSLSNSSQEQALAFVSQLADRLEEHVALAEKSITEGIEKLPMHGILSAIRDLIACITLDNVASQEYWRPLFTRLIALVDRVWAVTKTVISLTPSQTAGKPEHEIARAYDVLGAGDDEEAEDESMDHTNLLSGCWRATKEAGELLSSVISLPIKQAKADQVMWTRAQVDAAGLRFLVWMHEIRHRGTFSKIAIAFTELVDAVKTVESLRPLCRGWLQRELDVITTDSLSITRRSAALPYSVLALVASDIPLMDVAFDSLNDLARADNSASSDVTKIHAFNILKIILLDARQAKILDRYFERAVMTALHAFASPNWNVRNVGLILFSTSVHRTLASGRGSQDFFASRKTLASRHTLASWNANYPKVIPYITAYLQSQIRTGSDATNAHSPLFPVLIIVRSLRWSEPGAQLAESLLAAVGPYLGSKQWQVRSVAAQAVSSLLSPERALQTVLDWHVERPGSQNTRHGSLLLLQHLLDNVIAWDDVSPGVLRAIEDVLLGLVTSVEDKTSPLVKKAVIDAVSAFIRNDKRASAQIVDAVVNLSKASLKANNAVTPGYSLLLASATLCLLINSPSPKTIESLLQSNNEDAQVAVLETLATCKNQELTAQLAPRIITVALKDSSTAPRVAALEALVELDHASEKLVGVPDALKVRFAKQVLEVASSESCVPLRQAALVASGWALNLCISTEATWSQAAPLLPRLASLVDAASDIHQSQPARWSAVAALEPLAAQLFPSTSSAFDSVFVELHTVLLRLLQDDDESIRMAACSIVQRGHGYKRPVNQSVVLEREWEYLYRCIQWHPRKRGIVDLVYSKAVDADALESELAKLRTRPGEAGVLFEVEPPNLFRDPMVNIRLATRILARGQTTRELLTAQQIATAKRLLNEAVAALKEEEADGICAIDERYDTVRTLQLRVLRLHDWLPVCCPASRTEYKGEEEYVVRK